MTIDSFPTIREGSDAVPGPSDEERRLAAIGRTGLSNVADDRMERVCRMVARLLEVPVALVSIVDDTRQFFPGAHGLPPELADDRQTPLRQSLCRYVVAAAEPLRIDDLAGDARHGSHPAGPELGIGAYLGVPLVDGAGRVLGSLCAISDEPRTWTDDDTSLLVDLALGVSSDLRARISMSIANEARVETSIAHERLRMLLQASDALASSLDPDIALGGMLDTVVPSLARWAAVYFAPVDDVGPSIVVRHTDSSLDDALKAFVETPARRRLRPAGRPRGARRRGAVRRHARGRPAVDARGPRAHAGTSRGGSGIGRAAVDPQRSDRRVAARR